MFKRIILLLALGPAGYGIHSLRADQWTGSVEAHLDLDTPQYSRHETQTWTLTGVAPTIQGSIALYPAKWHYSGVGSSLGKGSDHPSSINWTIDASQDVQLAIFVRASDNKLTFHQWSPPVYVADALVVTTQTSSTNGNPPVTTVAKYGVNQWIFDWIEDAPNKTNVSGSNPRVITIGPPPPVLVYNGSTSAVITCSWHFVTGPQTSGTSITKSAAVPTKASLGTNPTPAATILGNSTSKTGSSTAVPPAKNHYRITATHVLINHEENDDPYKPHGKINEIFVTSFAEVFDRRTNSVLAAGTLLRTPIHGDINNSDPVKGIRVLAGSVSGSGGIETGDDIHLLMTSGSANAGYVPFVTWEGDLTSGIELVVLRPMVWVIGGTDQMIYTPYTNRLLYNEIPTDLVRLPVVQSALAQSTGLSVDTSPQLVTNGNWNFHEVRPMGILMTTPSNPSNMTTINSPDPTDSHFGLTGTFPCTLSDQVIVLTREKLESYLAGSPAKAIQVHAKGGWTVNVPVVPLGEYTLNLLIERL